MFRRKTLVYTHWYKVGSNVWQSSTKHVTTGEGGVHEIFVRPSGWIEIRMDSLDADVYLVAPSQALAMLEDG